MKVQNFPFFSKVIRFLQQKIVCVVQLKYFSEKVYQRIAFLSECMLRSGVSV